jgi:hypothetical protein
MPLRRHIETRRLADLALLAKNARYMTHEQYKRLVDNVRKDGALTSVPLVYVHQGRAEYDELPAGTEEVLSGNHRVQAAVDALGKDAESEVFIIDEPLPKQRRIAMQLSHNSIAGQDDPAVLKQLYDELDDLEWREFSGLDDKQLELLEQVDLASLSEASLDFLTVTITFLPAERDRAKELLDEAAKIARADERWLAPISQYDELLESLASAQGAHNVSNVATGLAVILGVFEAHLDDLRDGWYDPGTALPSRPGTVPVEAVLGRRDMPTEAAAIIASALEKMTGRGDATQPWQALERWAADYLAGE